VRVNFGAYLNNRAAVFLPDYSLDELLRLGVEAEDLGYHSVWLGDSLLARPRYDPIVTLTAIAARTSAIRLATGILQTHLRNPVVLALEWATLDTISKGRTILGASIGGGVPAMVDKECRVAGVPKARRGRAFEEGIRLLRALWTEESVTFAGEFYRLDDVSLGYRPVQKPHPPIWIACGAYNPEEPGVGPIGIHVAAEAGRFRGPFDRVARLGDGWLTEHATPGEFRETYEVIRRAAREIHGRGEVALHRALCCYINVASSRQAAWEEARRVSETYHQNRLDDATLERWLIHGDADACIDRLRAFEAAGVETFELVFAARNQGEQLRRVAREIFPAFS
jgi:alkanesulfonate monooxygenase SsuD/methylene tetrahydromethanopterin reductase-like flavin-dependent oxidoreductase (luciferase family)